MEKFSWLNLKAITSITEVCILFPLKGLSPRQRWQSPFFGAELLQAAEYSCRSWMAWTYIHHHHHLNRFCQVVAGEDYLHASKQSGLHTSHAVLDNQAVLG